MQALDDCTVEVAQGSITGLIGPNGSGKTTLFNVITGYERLDAGDVYLDGKKITNAPPQRVFALGIGRTFQLTRIFPRLTVMENMLVATQHRGGRRRVRNPLARAGGAADRRRALDLLEFTGIAGHAARWRTPCPTASASCSSWPTCWSPIRRWCCSTSRPAA